MGFKASPLQINQFSTFLVMVAYSFGSLVLKSLVVEMHKHVYQKQLNKLDVEVQNCCVNFLKNLKACGVL
jgi:thymidylate synthase